MNQIEHNQKVGLEIHWRLLVVQGPYEVQGIDLGKWSVNLLYVMPIVAN